MSIGQEPCLACGGEAVRWRLCSACGNFLAGHCLGKTRFTREPSALARHWPDQQTYRCELCGHWHNGRRAAPMHEERRREAIRRLRANGNGWLLGFLAATFEGMDRPEWKGKRDA